MNCNRIYPFDYCCDDSSVESESNNINVEANPTDEATEILNKLKVGETTYSTAQHGLTLTGTHMFEDEEGTHIIFREYSHEELERQKLDAKIEYLAMMGGIDL